MTTLSFQFRRELAERVVSASGELDLDKGPVAIMGPSGCGKTTLARWIAGLDPMGAGALRFGAETWVGEGVYAPLEERKVGYLPQRDALFPHLSVAANVGFGLRRANDRDARVDALLRRVGAQGLGGRKIQGLSGGERRKVALAQILAVKPRLLLLDEPFTGLDRGTKAALLAEVAELVRGLPTLLITHDETEAGALAREVFRFE